MTNSNPTTSAPDELLVESDDRETMMPYGEPDSRAPKVVVALVWTGFIIGMLAYLVLYYFPDLAEWRAW